MPIEQALSVVVVDRDDESRRMAENILRNLGHAREGRIGPFSDRTGFIDSQ